MAMIKPKLAGQVMQARGRQGWSQAQLAQELGITPPDVAEWEDAVRISDRAKAVLYFFAATMNRIRADLHNMPALFPAKKRSLMVGALAGLVIVILGYGSDLLALQGMLPIAADDVVVGFGLAIVLASYERKRRRGLDEDVAISRRAAYFLEGMSDATSTCPLPQPHEECTGCLKRLQCELPRILQRGPLSTLDKWPTQLPALAVGLIVGGVAAVIGYSGDLVLRLHSSLGIADDLVLGIVAAALLAGYEEYFRCAGRERARLPYRVRSLIVPAMRTFWGETRSGDCFFREHNLCVEFAMDRTNLVMEELFPAAQLGPLWAWGRVISHPAPPDQLLATLKDCFQLMAEGRRDAEEGKKTSGQRSSQC